jgi:hypothetical protein
VPLLMCAFTPKANIGPQSLHVRSGSLADMCNAKRHVRFTPNSDRESGFPHKVMSAFPPKADMCGALAHVCFGPKADIPSIDYLFCRVSRGRKISW